MHVHTPRARAHGVAWRAVAAAAARWLPPGCAAILHVRAHTTTYILLYTSERSFAVSRRRPFFLLFFTTILHYSLLIELHSMKRAVHCTCTGSLHNGARIFMYLQINIWIYDCTRCFLNLHYRPSSCNENRYSLTTGETCSHYRDPVHILHGTCFQYRGFPARPLFYPVQDCSV